MAESPPAAGRIFVSYRREETAYPAGWLFDRLTDHFSPGQVFKDVDSIQLGDDFVEVITRAVGSCDVLLAMIGNEWATIADEHGRRRLDDPDDFVRLEIEAALTRNVRVIPILVDGARMPRADEVPDSLVRLVRRQALELNPARFDFDTGRLLKVLDRTLAEVRATQEDSASTRAPMGTAPDPSATELPKTSGQRDRVERTPMSSIPAAATAAAGPLPLASGRRLGKQRRGLSKRAWVLTGAGVGVALILLIVVVLANSGTTRQPTAVSTTSSSTGAGGTTSPSTNEVLLQDDFSSRASGWEDGGSKPASGYTGGAYRISARPSVDGGGARGVPTKASRVYPSTPANVRIEVKGHRLPASDLNMEYGVLCRVDGDNAYTLTISDNYAKIARIDARYRRLKDVEIQVDPNSTNELKAVCTNVQGGRAEHLELWVNGQKAVEATDKDSPLLKGTVGLIVGTDNTKRASVAEFDDFIVRL